MLLSEALLRTTYPLSQDKHAEQLSVPSSAMLESEDVGVASTTCPLSQETHARIHTMRKGPYMVQPTATWRSHVYRRLVADCSTYCGQSWTLTIAWRCVRKLLD
mmetsp:Transcript_63946/g.177766  ORF Transcript_63946/g.177766 Transcript_63946/m.177766 type:complete len:104 (-) Transcript_63946:729-1040(-)